MGGGRSQLVSQDPLSALARHTLATDAHVPMQICNVNVQGEPKLHFKLQGCCESTSF